MKLRGRVFGALLLALSFGFGSAFVSLRIALGPDGGWTAEHAFEMWLVCLGAASIAMLGVAVSLSAGGQRGAAVALSVSAVLVPVVSVITLYVAMLMQD